MNGFGARVAAAALTLALAAGIAHGADAQPDETTFDASAFHKKPYEIGGYLEARQVRLDLNRDGTLYRLNPDVAGRRTLDQSILTLKPSGKFRAGDATLNFRAHLEADWASAGSDRAAHVARFDELYGAFKLGEGASLDAGKISLKWGKGYAWTAVGFVERAKDPNDPELAREGFTMLTGDWIRHFDGPLRTVAFTPVVLPVGRDVNADFGASSRTNLAAKLYLLWHDTDIDLMVLGNGTRSRRFGMDFSRNLTSSFEIHGEWARIDEAPVQTVSASGATDLRSGQATSWLAGVRHLSERETTTIVEYFRNGTGLSNDAMGDFSRYVDTAYAASLATGTDAPLVRAATLARGGYARPNPGRNYLYLRLSQKEPFDWLYFTPALTVIANVDDRSMSIVPELFYTGFTNVELRARAFFLRGRPDTEFAERQNDRRFDLQVRVYF